MHIRAYLFLMAAGILIPVVVFSGVALNTLQNAEKQAALRGLNETARSIALLVDRELYSAEAALRVLASSPSLEKGDLAAFYEQAKTANRGPTAWSVLLDPEGRQLINTVLPFGTPLPPTQAKGRIAAAIRTRSTVVSDVIVGATTRRRLTTLYVPVALSGGRDYVLSIAFATEHFNHLLASVNAPPGWVLGIIDGDGRFIARNLNSEELIGKPAASTLVQAARHERAGQLRLHTLEGVDSVQVFTHPTLSQWTIAVAAPVDLIEHSGRRATLVATLGLLAATSCAALLAAIFGGLHVRSIRRAVGAASDLGKGVPPAAHASRVTEMNELHAALHAAGDQLLQAQAYRKDAERERQALLEREQKARLMAEQQNNAKDQFLAMLGHELRNPLAPISTAAQLLKLQSIDEHRVRYASDVIARQVDHMNRLLGDMLDVSRVTRGLVSLNVELLDMNAVIERAAEQTHSLVELKHHKLELDLPPGPVMLRGDPTRLIQIVANLLGNAAKYTPPHGQLRLVLRASADEVVVTVLDNGEGIQADLLPRVFDLFSQGERTPDRSQGGLGLGLALVRSLVQLHGGTVKAESGGRDLGSCFTVHLPRHVAAADSAKAAPAGGAARGALRVMIVDDNVDGAVSLSLFLQAAGGHQVCTYYDASGALEWAAFEHPDVFILDIGLPDMTGYELARRLRAMPQFANALLIALTGYGQPQDRAQALAAGFDLHVAKPADPARILALLAGGELHPDDLHQTSAD